MKNPVINIFLLLALMLTACKDDRVFEQREFRIVSLAPSVTKILFHLGVEDKISGVTDYCKFGDRVETLVKEGKIKRVSAFNSFNFEKIVALQPDIVFGMDSVSFEDKTSFEKLIGKEKLVWLLHPRNFTDIKNQILSIGELVDRKEVANNLVADFDEKLDSIKKLADRKKSGEKKKKILVEIYFPPYTTVGKNTFIADIIRYAGAELALDIEEDWPTPGLEDIIKSNPDFIIKTHIEQSPNKNLLLLDAYSENRIFIPKDIDAFLQPGFENADAVIELYNYIENNKVKSTE